ncbi:18076_t:CDS:1, partial [Gigaspora margarita]
MEIATKLVEWLNIIKYKNKNRKRIIKNKGESRIEKQFLESEEISKNLPIIEEKLNNIYTSKKYNMTEF